MAFDGITISNITAELSDKLLNGRIGKIAQPEKDELILTIKTNDGQFRLLLSADASLPLIYLTEENKPSPMTAPNFCMLLRKHLQNARIVAIEQPGLERVIRIRAEHPDEMGDLCMKTLIIEIMGKHSNIIFCDENDRIIDSIKRVSAMVSSVREVLPGKPYFIPETTEKVNPLTENKADFLARLKGTSRPLYQAIYGTFTGISPLVAQEICFRARIDGDMPTNSLSEDARQQVSNSFFDVMQLVKNREFSPCLIYENGKLKDYACFPFLSRNKEDCVFMDSISALLNRFYAEKNLATRIHQRSADLRKIVQTALERSVKKLDLQKKQLEDTKNRDVYRIYGELLNTYGYEAKAGDREISVLNYYTNEQMMIPLDPMLSAKENAQRYFDKYGKQKRTFEALNQYIVETQKETEYLTSVQTFLKIAVSEDDLLQIREELVQNGFIKKRSEGKKKKLLSKPFHFVTKDGYEIYVGKNNIQNEELTFRFATGNDWWFHAKGVPGSHVILKVKSGAEEMDLPDHVFEAAARLAAHFSSVGAQEKAEVDYTRKKNLKKPPGANAGFVIYHTNYSLLVSTDISGLDQR